ncbi:MAG: hypothetical protein IAF38_11210 [Bacteroidia bacterium]|nr:hypothetical protein [Bacteroidia bacterium]
MKPIFSGNNDYNKSAFLNWRISKHDDIFNLLNLAEGFLFSSIEQAKSCLANNDDKRADILIFPILTNANHGIELYLKAILWMLNKLSGSDTKIEGAHNIKQIYQTIRSRIKNYKGQLSLKEFDEDTKELNSYINELIETINSTEKSDKMDFSRYPFNNKYENHFYVGALGNIEVDMEIFVSRFESIHNNLNHLSSFLHEWELNENEENYYF